MCVTDWLAITFGCDLHITLKESKSKKKGTKEAHTMIYMLKQGTTIHVWIWY